MKHFVQNFAPGASRSEGVDSFSGSHGAAVLRDACAYMECRIVSRTDSTDHWIAYAEVTGGNVANDEAMPAVHRRKVGTHTGAFFARSSASSALAFFLDSSHV